MFSTDYFNILILIFSHFFMGTKFGSSFQDQYVLHSFLFELGKKEKGEIFSRNLKREWGEFYSYITCHQYSNILTCNYL